jgi:hypothetical protein
MKEGEILFQATEGPVKAGSLVVVKSIAEALAQNNKKYYKVELADGTKVSVWNPKQLEGIEPGSLVSYELQKNDKGFWNLKKISKAEADPLRPPPTQERTETPKTPETLSDKEFAMRSMNALTNATTFTCALIDKGILEPKTSIDAFKVLKDYHKAMLGLHIPPPLPQANEGEIKK